jgi:hypothetical protein
LAVENGHTSLLASTTDRDSLAPASPVWDLPRAAKGVGSHLTVGSNPTLSETPLWLATYVSTYVQKPLRARGRPWAGLGFCPPLGLPWALATETGFPAYKTGYKG